MKEKADTEHTWDGGQAGSREGKSRVRNLTYIHSTEGAARMGVEDPGTGMLVSMEGTGRWHQWTGGGHGHWTRSAVGGGCNLGREQWIM